MQFSQLHLCRSILCLGLFSLLAGCGGGGGGSSSTPAPTPAPQPSAVLDDGFSIIQNTPSTFAVISNDTNVDATSLSVTQQPSNGAASVANGQIEYTPNNDFVGNDQLTYGVTGNDGQQLEGVVTIDVSAITLTTTQTEALNLPTSGYVSINNAERGADVLTSPTIEFEISPNAVSFSLALTGSDVGDTAGNLFIAELTQPNQTSLTPLDRFVTFCDPDFCSGVIPRRPDQAATRGTWSLRVGTLDPTLNSIDFADIALSLTQRVGPEPTVGARLRERPFLTASSVDSNELSAVLDQLEVMAQASNLTLEFDPIQLVTDARFESVSRSFSDPTTSELVELGAADRINLFFLEEFSGAGSSGLLGISGGLPGPFGQANEFNGVLVNATAFLDETTEVYNRNTAEIALHEMGHFLGLYHTTERQFDPHDVLDDTPECLIERDNDTTGVRGVADIDECPDGQNLMFWNSDFTGNKEPLSTDQQEVIFSSPLALPDS